MSTYTEQTESLKSVNESLKLYTVIMNIHMYDFEQRNCHIGAWGLAKSESCISGLYVRRTIMTQRWRRPCKKKIPMGVHCRRYKFILTFWLIWTRIHHSMATNSLTQACTDISPAISWKEILYPRWYQYEYRPWGGINTIFAATMVTTWIANGTQKQ